jgi:Flp pilus assembly protein TadB
VTVTDFDIAPLAFALLGGVGIGGILLFVWSLIPHEYQPSDPNAGLVPFLRSLGVRLPLTIGAVLLTLVFTQWPVAAAAAGALVLAGPALFGGARAERMASARLAGLAVWTESLRDTIAGAVGLEQAIMASASAPPPAISGDVKSLADRLRVRVPMPRALRMFADDLNDPGADLICSALILNSRLRGPGLRQVLSSLADAARDELQMRERIAAGRQSTRRSVMIVVGVTLFFVLGLRWFNPGYVAPYGTLVGQTVLLIVILLFAGGFFWLRRLAAFDLPGRFLTGGADPTS